MVIVADDVDDVKRELVKDVHHLVRLGVRSSESNDDGIYVQNGD